MKNVTETVSEFFGITIKLAGLFSVPVFYIYVVRFGVSFDSNYFFLRSSCFIALIGAAFGLWKLIRRESKRYCLTEWWDPADLPGGPITWSMVLKLTIGCPFLDPINTRSDIRKFWTNPDMSALVMLAFAIAIASLLIFCAQFLLNPHVPTIFSFTCNKPDLPNALMNLSGNLTALLALIGAVISIYFTYHQLRSKVRADNRQVWIAQLRRLIAEVIPLAEERAKAGYLRERELRAKLDPLRLELELMLNPSEKDHRFLMYLIQRLCRLNTPDFGSIEDAENTRKSIECEYTKRARESDFKKDWLPILDSVEVHELVNYTMRLSHVVLKREWERVKNTQ